MKVNAYSVDLLDILVDVWISMFLNQERSSPSKSLLAMAVGIKQKEIVNRIVEKVEMYLFCPLK